MAAAAPTGFRPRRQRRHHARARSAIADPGPGADRVEGGRIVRSRDGARDQISSCGTALADRRDVVRGCRGVRRG